MNTSRQRPPQRRGLALVWVAIAGMVFIVFLALAADAARVFLARHQLQNGADAAALAGVYRVRNDPRPDGEPAAHYAARINASNNRVGGSNAQVGGGTVQLASNLANAPGGDIVIGCYDNGSDTFTPTLSSPNAVQVTARRTTDSPGGALPLLFAPVIQLFGGGGQAGTQSNVARTATAVIGGPSIQAGLILLNRDDPNTLDLRGTGSVDPRILVTGGGVQVNSDDPNAVNWAGEPTIDATGLFIGSNQPDAAALVPSGVVSPNAPPVPDPLGSLPPPPQPAAPSKPNPDSSGLLKPGYYTKNDWPKNAEAKLASGIYWIDGGLDTTQNIDASRGVLLFFNTGSLVMRGNAQLTIAPMNSGTWAGISIYQARGNTATATIRGSETQASSGVFYLPSAEVIMWGTPMSACTQLIADKLDMRGTGQLTINYNGGNPILGHKIWLVR
jgi:Flp pilus assembly protein TadG